MVLTSLYLQVSVSVFYSILRCRRCFSILLLINKTSLSSCSTLPSFWTWGFISEAKSVTSISSVLSNLSLAFDTSEASFLSTKVFLLDWSCPWRQSGDYFITVGHMFNSLSFDLSISSNISSTVLWSSLPVSHFSVFWLLILFGHKLSVFIFWSCQSE